MRSDKLQNAIGNISDQYILDAHSEKKTKSRKSVIRKVLLTAACAVVMCAAALIIFVGNKKMDYEINNLWKTNTKNDFYASLKKEGSFAEKLSFGSDSVIPELSDKAVFSNSKTSVNTQVFTAVDFENGISISSARKKMVSDFISQYYTTVFTFDYAAQFQLFQPEFCDVMFTQRLNEHYGLGLSYEQLIERCNKNADMLKTFDGVNATISVTDCRKMSRDEINDVWLEQAARYFKDAGLDTNKISKAIYVEFHSSSVVIDGVAFIDENLFSDGPVEFVIYSYDGKWYLSPDLFDNDLSLDLALASPLKNTHGYFMPFCDNGQIQWISGEHFRVGKRIYYVSDKTLLSNFNAGDTVTVTGYSGLRSVMYDIQTGDTIELFGAQTISKAEE